MYEIQLTKRSSKDLQKIKKGDGRAYAAIIKSIRDLARDPYPAASKALGGREGHRIRVGQYRILYSVNDSQLVIEVLRAGPRGDVYK